MSVSLNAVGATTQLDVDSSTALHGFHLDRILSEDARNKSANLLGHFGKDERAIVLLEKTHFSSALYSIVAQSAFSHFRSLGSNDVYTWLLAWMDAGRTGDGQSISTSADAHVKITLIRPATETHILKYSEQTRVLINETAQVYADVVQPWIAAQPIDRVQWVYNILDKKEEADTILYEQPGTSDGFVVLPDLKWDRVTLSSLYMVAIVHNRSLRSMRDLTAANVPMLREVIRQGERVARERFGLGKGEQLGSGQSKLRCFIHYQPTYYHLHVHLLSSDYATHPGSVVGQAHLLQDVIDLLELGVDFKQRTFSYMLGSRNALLAHLQQHTIPTDDENSAVKK